MSDLKKRNIIFAKTPNKYVERLDAPTKARIYEKLDRIAADFSDPPNSALSLPLAGNPPLRYTRVGDYRIIFDLLPETVSVTDVGPRGDVYRKY